MGGPTYVLPGGAEARFPKMVHTLFVVAGGPSLNQTDLSLLRKRGVVVMTVNNAWLKVRPQLAVFVDPPSNFSDLGWKDPTIPWKFVPDCYRARKISTRLEDGRFVDSRWRVDDMPGVVFYPRRTRFDISDYFTSREVSWGHVGKTQCSAGHKGVRSVMHSALRIGWDLGFRHFRLVGCDFHMSLRKGRSAYAFEQEKDERARRSNNRTYAVLKDRLALIHKRMKEMGGGLTNCTVGGQLDTIPRMPLEKAVSLVHSPWAGGMPTEGWYNRSKKKLADQQRTAKEYLYDAED